MSEVVIRVENLSKEYRLGSISHDTLYHDLQSGWAKFQGKEDPNSMVDFIKGGVQPNEGEDTFCALRNISFDVQKGEILGIIGRNGAGKSTLLKIMSRVTAPTRGTIKIRGRVASLLEVGTGFNPELSGRENIFLNGAILGMQKREIEQKFDEIVKFSEINKFIDTPVKRYSSGMHVRLAFAIAAHLEPEILILDEVLAVGDAQFQNKCLGKMNTIANEGRTILFVSHNMDAIKSICQRGIWIDNGVIMEDGQVNWVINKYLPKGEEVVEGKRIWTGSHRPGNDCLKINSITLKDLKGNITSQVNISEEAIFEIEYSIIETTRAQFSLVFFDGNGSEVFATLSNTPENLYHGKNLQEGNYRSRCFLYGNLLNEGRYSVSILGLTENWMNGFKADLVLTFNAVEDGKLKGDYPGSYGGVVRPKLVWKTEPVEQ